MSNDLDRDDVFIDLATEIISGYYWYLHFGTPCARWSALSHLNGGSRTLANPDGIRPLTQPEAKSFLQVDRMCVLCALLARRKGFFTIENPACSLMFASSPVQALTGLVQTWTVVLDQCSYGLRPPSAEPWEFTKKSTKLLANFPAIMDMERRCPGVSHTHRHTHAIGSRRITESGRTRSVSLAMSASRYPAELCASLAL